MAQRAQPVLGQIISMEVSRRLNRSSNQHRHSVGWKLFYRRTTWKGSRHRLFKGDCDRGRIVEAMPERYLKNLVPEESTHPRDPRKDFGRTNLEIIVPTKTEAIPAGVILAWFRTVSITEDLFYERLTAKRAERHILSSIFLNLGHSKTQKTLRQHSQSAKGVVSNPPRPSQTGRQQPTYPVEGIHP